jgi:hypothetical protein
MAGLSDPGRRGVMLAPLLLAACARLPRPATVTEGPYDTLVHVIRRGWHTDIAVPAAGPLVPELASLTRDFPGVRHLVFGFGDRAYLMEPGAGPLATMRALLPGRGAILLTALAATPEAAFGPRAMNPGAVVALPLAGEEFCRLQQFLAGSLDRGGLAPGDRLRPLAAGPYPGSVFHASTITYAATYTCNTWTAEAIAMAGVPLRADGVLLAGQVMARVGVIALQRSPGASPKGSQPALGLARGGLG